MRRIVKLRPVVCSGNNGGGQFGDGTTTTRPAPTVVLDSEMSES